MNRLVVFLVIALVQCGTVARAETVPSRPDLNGAKPIATCELQTIAVDPNANAMQQQVIISSLLQAPPDDPLLNYERTPLGDWYKPAASGREDPWLRLVLLAPDKPVVVDLAVFIDGKPYRNAREAWIDEVYAAAKAAPVGGADPEPAGNKEAAATGTNTTSEAPEAAASSKETASSDEKAAPEVEKTLADAKPASDEESASDAESAKGAETSTDKSEGDKESQEDSKAEAEEKEKEKKPVVPGVKAQARQAPTMRDRLISYLTAAGAEVDRQEIDWLIGEWGSGPSVVVLGAGQAWQRASVAPLLAYLDQDASGSLAAEEISSADELLNRADFNGDEVVDVNEIRKATKHSLAQVGPHGHSLVALIDANTDWSTLSANLSRAYKGNANVKANAASEFGTCPADVTLRIDFKSDGDAKKKGSSLSTVSVSEGIAAAKDAVIATSDVISVDLGGDYLEISAAQANQETTKDISGSQLAIGAAIDGNPLLRLLDGDQDGRLTLRERQQLAGLLAALDRDADKQISASEVPMPIRLAVTLGPRVHELLARPTGAARMIATREVSQAPDWFASMDKNKDGDLSRGEFLGTTEQFRQFDENGDQLLGVAEALKLNPGE
jgi:hypothetical protein